MLKKFKQMDNKQWEKEKKMILTIIVMVMILSFLFSIFTAKYQFVFYSILFISFILGMVVLSVTKKPK